MRSTSLPAPSRRRECRDALAPSPSRAGYRWRWCKGSPQSALIIAISAPAALAIRTAATPTAGRHRKRTRIESSAISPEFSDPEFSDDVPHDYLARKAAIAALASGGTATIEWAGTPVCPRTGAYGTAVLFGSNPAKAIHSGSGAPSRCRPPATAAAQALTAPSSVAAAKENARTIVLRRT